MRIGFDAKRAFFNKSGLGNYSRTLLNSLAKAGADKELVLYSPKIPATALGGFGGNEKPFQLITPCRTIHKKFSSVWRSKWLAGQLENDGLDIYHGLSAELPYGIHKTRLKTVVTVHDLIFLHHPEFYAAGQVKIIDHKCRYACKVADRVVAISHETAGDLVRMYGISKEKIEVIYQGIDPAFDRKCNEQELSDIRKKYVIDGPFAFFVGNIEPRKNLLNLLESWQKTGIADGQLLIAGSGKKYLERLRQFISEHKLEDRVRLLGRVPSADLPGLYQAARMFVYPALMEGFGIPIVEAMVSGTPLVSSQGGVFGEAGGKAARYADPRSPDSLAKVIGEVWGDEKLRLEMSKKGLIHAKQFDRDLLARQWLGLYQDLLDENE